MFGCTICSVLYLINWYFHSSYLIIHYASVCHGEIAWQLTYVPKANFTSGMSYGKVASLASFSDITCALASAKMGWPRLFCFQNGKCLITMYQTVPRSTSDGITDPVQCMTNFRENDCDLKNGTVIANGTTWDFYCGKQVCSQGKIVPTGPFIPPNFGKLKTCLSPFTKISGFGCGAYFSPAKSFCAARQQCLDLGADLINLGVNESNSRLTLFAVSLDAANFWVGLESLKGETNYTWDLGGTVGATDNIWDTKPESKNIWQCAYAKSSSDKAWALKQDDCTNSYNVGCEIPNAL